MKHLFETTKMTEYYITDNGEVLSFNKKTKKYKKKKISLNKSRGYFYVRTEKKNYLVHRLIAKSFIKNPYNKPTVNHKNGIKTDNRIKNLEWMTYQENMDHAKNNNLLNKFKKNEGNVKYTNNQCKDVKKRVESGMSYKKAGQKYNMPYSTVAHLIRGSRREI